MNLIGTPDGIMEMVRRMHPQAPAAVRYARHLTAGHSTKGSVYDYQAAVLFSLAHAYNRTGAMLLEIGTYYGATAAVMGQAAPMAQIVTLNPTLWEADVAEDCLREFENVQVLCETSQAYFAAYGGPALDFIFVDGDHKLIRSDLRWWNYLAVGGTMLFHDYTPEGAPRHCPPVVRALDDFTRLLGREADHRIIDDQQAGMLAWVKQEGDCAYG